MKKCLGSMSNEELFSAGVRLCIKFLELNNLYAPQFYTYDEVLNCPPGADVRRFQRALRTASGGSTVSMATGLYLDNHVFVNLGKVARPVQQPSQRRWSYPCYKVDRTACGVVAHEVGHHVEHVLRSKGRMIREEHGVAWRKVVKGRKVTSYEPVPSEAFAESMRLFILNPALLRAAIPQRYAFLAETLQLRRSEKREWEDVLELPAYRTAAQNWVSK